MDERERDVGERSRPLTDDSAPNACPTASKRCAVLVCCMMIIICSVMREVKNDACTTKIEVSGELRVDGRDGQLFVAAVVRPEMDFTIRSIIALFVVDDVLRVPALLAAFFSSSSGE
jgi:hypothetical protein